MSKLLLPLIGLCLFLWLVGGAFWFGKYYAKPSVTSSTSNVSSYWQVSDGDALVSSSPTVFAFQQSDAEIILNDEQFDALKTIATYLNSHPDRQLSLEGSYHVRESNGSRKANLGLARAETLRQILRRRGVPDQQMVIKAKALEKLPLNENGLINQGVDFSFDELPVLAYGADFSLEKEIIIEETVAPQVGADFVKYAAALKQYLVDHPEEKLFLTGFHKNKDTAQKWGNYIFEKLEKEGVAADRMEQLYPKQTAGKEAAKLILIVGS